MKRFATLLVIFALLLGISPAFAAERKAEAAADTLYDLGLFRGTGTDAQGNPVYDLDRSPTRAEALVMLVRLLGAEQGAQSGSWKHPFGDVPAWAAPYVGYAYEKGLTKGVSADSFGTETIADAKMYLTFVLRAMGYSDSGEGADFDYSSSDAYAKTIGLASKDYNVLLRGDAAEISLTALDMKLKGSDKTLIQTLVESGAVDGLAAEKAGFDVDYARKDYDYVMVNATYNVQNNEYQVSSADLKKAFPEAAALFISAADNAMARHKSDRFTPEELEFLFAYQCSQEGKYNSIMLSEHDLLHVFNARYCHYVIDEDFNILGVFYSTQKNLGNKMEFIVGNEGVDGSKLTKMVSATLDKVTKNYDAADVRVEKTDYDPWDDGGGMTHAYAVTVNGVPMSSEMYVGGGWFSKESLENDTVDIYGLCRQFMFLVLFLSDNSLVFENGESLNYYFSDYGGRFTYDYGTKYGTRLRDVRTNYSYFFVYDTSGTVYGYTIVPPTE